MDRNDLANRMKNYEKVSKTVLIHYKEYDDGTIKKQARGIDNE